MVVEKLETIEGNSAYLRFIPFLYKNHRKAFHNVFNILHPAQLVLVGYTAISGMLKSHRSQPVMLVIRVFFLLCKRIRPLMQVKSIVSVSFNSKSFLSRGLPPLPLERNPLTQPHASGWVRERNQSVRMNLRINLFNFLGSLLKLFKERRWLIFHMIYNSEAIL